MVLAGLFVVGESVIFFLINLATYVKFLQVLWEFFE